MVTYMEESDFDESESYIHHTPSSSNKRAAMALILVTVLERCGYFTLTSNLPFTLSRWFSTEGKSISNCSSSDSTNINFVHLDTLSVVIIMTCFYVLCSVFSVLGGWLGDSKLGRYRTLVASFVLYFLGSVVFMCLVYIMICNSSVPTTNIMLQNNTVPDLAMCLRYQATNKTGRQLQWVLLVVSFLLISLGYGFCKPNIAPFGADQLQNMAGDYLQMFYFWFYFFSNVGALLAFAFSFFQTPDSTSSHYLWSYGVPVIGSAVSFAILLLCSNLFVKKTPSEDTLKTFFLILKEWLASFKVSRAVIANTGDTRIALLKKVNGGPFSDQEVDAFVDLWRIIPVIGTMLIYWACHSQFYSLYYIQGIYLERPTTIPLSLICSLNPFIILIMVPLLNNVIYPYLKRKNLSMHVFTRIQIGFALAALSLLGAIVVAWKERIWTRPEYNPTKIHYFHSEDQDMQDYVTYTVRDMSILWLSPQIILMSLSEVFTIIASMEFVYREAPAHMKSFAMGIYVLVAALGNALALILVLVVKYLTTNKNKFLGGEWICNNLNNGHIANFFALLMFLMLFNMCCFFRNSKKFAPDYSNLRFRFG